VRDFFSYAAKPINDERAPVSIWAEGQWWTVREYHEQRGLPRRWVFGAAVQDADIRPGDIALIRHKGVKPAKESANHIVMVDSWDRVTGKLITIEGNVKEGIRPETPGSGDLKYTKGGEVASTTTSSPSSTAMLVDFEHHEYGKQAVPTDLKYTSPDEMRLRGKRKLLAPESTRAATRQQ
jgi:hypothetical protein